MVQLVTSPAAMALFTTLRFITGSSPGMPAQAGHTFSLASALLSLAQEQKILDSVASSTWTSSPITVSQAITVHLLPKRRPQ